METSLTFHPVKGQLSCYLKMLIIIQNYNASLSRGDVITFDKINIMFWKYLGLSIKYYKTATEHFRNIYSTLSGLLRDRRTCTKPFKNNNTSY